MHGEYELPALAGVVFVLNVEHVCPVYNIRTMSPSALHANLKEFALSTVQTDESKVLRMAYNAGVSATHVAIVSKNPLAKNSALTTAMHAAVTMIDRTLCVVGFEKEWK